MFRVICLGDSITFGGGEEPLVGWVGRINQKLDVEKCNGVFNLGISGNTTDDLKGRIENELKFRVDRSDEGQDYIIIISIGINDTNKKHITPEHIFIEDFNYILRTAKKHSDKVIVLSQTPVDESKTNPIYEDSYYDNKRIENCNEIIEKLSKENDCNFCDVGTYFKSKNYKSLLDDGLHPNSRGYDVMAEFILKEISVLTF